MSTSEYRKRNQTIGSMESMREPNVVGEEDDLMAVSS